MYKVAGACRVNDSKGVDARHVIDTHGRSDPPTRYTILVTLLTLKEVIVVTLMTGMEKKREKIYERCSSR